MRMNQAKRRRAGWLALACTLVGASAQAEACRPKGPLPADAVVASWYGAEHRGHKTASGEFYDERQLTAAHPSIPLQTIIRIRNLLNGNIVKVRVTDRGPGYGRGIDLSEAAADALGMRRCGLAHVLILADR
jgi:rare lipoprotein A